MQVRKIKLEDAEKFIELNKLLESETDFLLLSSDELNITIEEQEKLIKKFHANNDAIIFVIEIDTKLIGFIGGKKGLYKKNQHILNIAIGILEKYTGLGYGKQLLEYVEKWALVNGIMRIELSVRKDNKRAIKLYEKCGFTIEGIKLKSLKINNQYFDEFYMSKLIS